MDWDYRFSFTPRITITITTAEPPIITINSIGGGGGLVGVDDGVVGVGEKVLGGGSRFDTSVQLFEFTSYVHTALSRSMSPL
ncbi:MAG: hypothetical protein ACW987_12405, partial [Candidatus Thorarchaeota archaeon]